MYTLTHYMVISFFVDFWFHRLLHRKKSRTGPQTHTSRSVIHLGKRFARVDKHMHVFPVVEIDDNVVETTINQLRVHRFYHLSAVTIILWDTQHVKGLPCVVCLLLYS